MAGNCSLLGRLSPLAMKGPASGRVVYGRRAIEREYWIWSVGAVMRSMIGPAREKRALCYQGGGRWANGRIPSLRQGVLVIGLHVEGFVSCRWID